MSRFSRLHVYNHLAIAPVLPIFHVGDAPVGKAIIDALARGGALALEMTNRGDGALETWKELAIHIRKNHPNLAFGAGTITDASTAALFIAAGSDFIVSPFFDLDTALLCNSRKIAYMPGCATATEIHMAEKYGCEIVKIFPGDSAGGPNFIKAVKAPCPWSNLMPTGGVELSEKSIRAWMDAGAYCVGMGSNLIPKAALEKKDYSLIEANMRQALEWATKKS